LTSLNGRRITRQLEPCAQAGGAKAGKSHAPFLDCSIEIAAWTKLHDFTPAEIFILNEINGLDDIWMMEGRRYTELCSEFLDIFLFGLVLAAFAEFLDKQVRRGYGDVKRKKEP
jgi:hypothetical protein